MITPVDNAMFAAQKEFMYDLHNGLSQKRKQIPSKYFYDKKGCDLFNAITRHHDYYLTQCEIEILTRYKTLFSRLFPNEAFNLIELGPGEGIKTRIIIEQLMKDHSSFTYIPIDISKKYLDSLAHEFLHTFKGLQFHGIKADWLDGLKHNKITSSSKNIVLFLGSSIGNFTPETSAGLLKNISMSLKNGDFILIGFDLCKDHHTIFRAYNDSAGITRKFNLNLLDRINNELGGDFDITQFEHQPRYNYTVDAMESYLVSRTRQSVNIKNMNKTYHFKSNEEIHVESSYKYKFEQIEQFARTAGFTIVENFYDARQYFLCSLWKIK